MGNGSSAFLRIEKLTRGRIEGYEEWSRILLGNNPAAIGRYNREEDIAAPDIKIVGDDYISRSQAEIYYSVDNKVFMLRDTGSLSGTFLNGEHLEKDRSYALKDQDLIGLAKIEGEMRILLRFRTSDATIPPWIQEKKVAVDTDKGLFINEKTKRVYVSGKEIPLTKTEYKILAVLATNKGSACSMDDIAYEVWGKRSATDDLINQYIRRLRKKVEVDPSKPRYITTVPGHQHCYQLDL